MRGVRFVISRPGGRSQEAALGPAASAPTAWTYMETCWLPPTQSCCNVHNVHDVHLGSRNRPSVDVLMSGPSRQVVSSLGLRSQSRSNTGQRQWQVSYCEALSFFWRERKRWRYLGPFFLYPSDPAFKKASQICATLRPSRAAITSRFFFRPD